MDKITREDIDNMIMGSFHETGSDDVLSGFSDSLNSNISALEENGLELDGQVIIFLSSIITAQTNAINTIRGGFTKSSVQMKQKQRKQEAITMYLTSKDRKIKTQQNLINRLGEENRRLKKQLEAYSRESMEHRMIKGSEY